ncbi:sigma-70 family RNA polymerase sigma factor [Fodinicola feengrottensis]|uniref:Sigma-70 family RNA polymerase sigma factor n=1 Tax=Fodinicola feengrottensis TaxID=435914 RepID=A0ABN2G2X6_9ACTN
MTTLDTTDWPPFEITYRRHAPRVYRFCLSRVTDPDAAEELTADTFAHAYAAYSRFSGDEEGIWPWLLRIARNAVIDHHRRRGRRRAIADRYLAPTGTDLVDPVSVERRVIARDDLRTLGRCLARLADRDRQLIGLRVGGAGAAEIGRVLGMSPHAATVATGRALARLRHDFDGLS